MKRQIRWVIFVASVGALGCSFNGSSKVSGQLTQAGSANTPSSVSQASIASISVGTSPGIAIPSTFMGLSHEWGNVQANYMGMNSTGVNNIYRQLISNLTAYGSGPLILRIGGNSTDSRGEPASTVVEPFAEVATALGTHFYLGISLGPNNVGLAVDQATFYTAHMPAGYVDGIEIGNEPDLYYRNGYRPSTYNYQNYLSDFQTWIQNVKPVIPSGMKFVAPAWGSTGMLVNIGNFLSNESSSIAVFTQHFYQTNPAANPSADYLLKPAAATLGPSTVASAVTNSHSFGIPFRMGEFSSVGDQGVHGVSDVFATALWGIDTMFEYANVGVDGVNWESSDGNYCGPFNFSKVTTNGIDSFTLSTLNPLYYGLLLFQAATPNHAQLLPVTVSTTANLKAWGTVDASGVRRLVIINKDESMSGNIDVTEPGFSKASVLRLTAPSYQSFTGVTFAGQTLDGSPDGKLQGTQSTEQLSGSTGGVFQLSMGPTSAALIVFSN